jgi:hypothetical protein
LWKLENLPGRSCFIDGEAIGDAALLTCFATGNMIAPQCSVRSI